jgi:GMP reductase
MIINDIKFDFNDILIVPEAITNIESRYKGISINDKHLPLMTAPMDTVVDLNNMTKFIDEGITVVLPRTISYFTFLAYVAEKPSFTDINKVFFSFGFEDIEVFLKSSVVYHKNINILIDVANGHMKKVLQYAKKIKKHRPDVTIMAGNIANPATYGIYAKNKCIDYVRCSIGTGNGCLTTKNVSVGYPMGSLIYEIKKIKNDLEAYDVTNLPKIVADGGMKDYSDIIKALALGADYVMIGSVFNKSIESAGFNYFLGFRIKQKTAEKLFKLGYVIKKKFRGMSTKQAQKAMGASTLKTSEGVIRFRKVEYTLHGWVENFKHYLRSCMSYTDCKKIDEFIGGPNIVKITQESYNRFNK